MLTAARRASWRPCAQPGVAAALSTTSLLGSTAARRAVLHPQPHVQRQRRSVAMNLRQRRADDSSCSSVVSQRAGQSTDIALKVVVVGAAGPVGLAAAAALARRGADVEVHSSCLDPRSDPHGALEGGGTLVALGKRGLQAMEDLRLSHSPQGANARADSSSSSNSTDPLPGLLLLQGLVVVGGPQGVVSQEKYSRSKPGSSGGVTTGIAAIAESSLTDHLLALATTAAGDTAGPDAPQALISGAQVTAASVASAAAARHSSSTPLPQGPTSAPSAEAAQLAAMPDTVVVADSLDDEGTSGITVRYHSQLVLLDTANKQATFLGEGGQAHVAPYDLLIAADAGSSAQLVSDTLQELQKREAAHTHPSAATTTSSSRSAVSQAGVEAEWMAWQDMPHEPSLAHLLPRGAVGGNASSASKVSSTDGRHPSGPTRGWLLAWRGSNATGANTAAIPGAPGCTVLAWPGAMGATWSGCVLAHPQVFEALHTQADYQQLLQGLSGRGGACLPRLWVDGIAQQLKQYQGRIGRLRAAAGPPPAHLSAPAAGLLTLSSAAVPAAAAPQLLNPAVSLGLAEVASLVSALAEAAGAQATASVLQQFDSQHQPDAAALHNLLAQLSWLRHAHSPARSAAAASVTWGSLAWLVGGVLRAPRAGLVLQWRCLATLLPLVAAIAAAKKKTKPDRPAGAAGAASTSLDSGAALAQGEEHAPPRPAATTSSPAYSLSAVLEAIEPCSSSLAALLHTTDVRPSTLWRLLQWAPLLLATLWGAAFYFLVTALRWSLWACAWATSAVA